jgi:hypothetical protein
MKENNNVNQVKVFKFNGTEYVKALTEELAISYFKENCDQEPYETIEEIPMEMWEKLWFKTNEGKFKYPLHAFIIGTDPELIISIDFLLI